MASGLLVGWCRWRLETAVHLLVHQGIEGDGGAHQGLVALHHPAVALDPVAGITAGQARAIPGQQLQVVLLGQQGEHQLVDALAAGAHGQAGGHLVDHHGCSDRGAPWLSRSCWM